MMHIGHRIQQVLREQERSATWFADKLCYTRSNVYKIFDRSSIDTFLLRRISKILNHDFFEDLSEDISDTVEK
ncbi:MAG: XRE family transcriptional regulator [Bacteroidaceae bacterium]|nr:XRE family transcriptional regulator [Bacteroidaceae bacterium]